jgi:anti-repressor protein
MSELKIFENPEFGKIRMLTIDNQPWFVAKDVCDILELKNPSVSIQSLEEDERSKLYLGRQGDANCINESGLYALIIRSNKPEAKKFRKWVTSEVLPSIRKSGGYITGQESMTDAELLAKALLVAQRQIEERNALIERMRPKEIFADAVSASKSAILVGDLAKILCQNGVQIGQKRLFEWMRENGYLIKQKGASWNMPTQRSMDAGWFEVKETTITHSDGHISVNKTAKVSGKGQVYFVNKFLRKAEVAENEQ